MAANLQQTIVLFSKPATNYHFINSQIEFCKKLKIQFAHFVQKLQG